MHTTQGGVHFYLMQNSHWNQRRESWGGFVSNEWDEGEERGALLQGSEPDRDGSNYSSSAITDSSYYSRWQSFCGVCLYVSVAGTTYGFGVYSELLRSRLGYSEDALDIVASIGNNGLYLSLFAGYAVQKFGFKSVVLVGGAFIFVGFLYMWLAILQALPSNIQSICFFYFLSQAGVCCHISSAVTVSVKLFPPEARGAAIGLSKGYFALSTAVLSDLAGGIFRSSVTSFLLFLAIFIPITGYIGSSMANILPSSLTSFNFERFVGSRTSLQPFLLHWMTLFVCLLLVALVQYKLSLSYSTEIILSGIVLFTVASILFIPEMYSSGRVICADDLKEFEAHLAEKAKKARVNFNTFQQAYRASSSLSPPLMQPPSSQPSPNDASPTTRQKTMLYADFLPEIAGQEGTVSDTKPLVSDSTTTTTTTTTTTIEYESISTYIDDCYYGDSQPLSNTFFMWRMWALFIIFLSSAGSGLMVIYNVEAVAEALGVTPSAYFVTLISLANGLGRVTAGLSSDEIVQHTSISKLQLLSVIVFCMSVMQFILSIGSLAALSVSLLLVGFLFGSTTALVAVNVADIFGEKYIATNYGFIDTSPIIGSYFLATFIADLFYTENGTNDNGESICLGVECFRYSFIVNGSVCLFSSLLCYYIHWKTDRRSQYSDL